MFDYLIHHARRTAWCSPQQDMQVIFCPAKINRRSGSIVSGPHLWSRINMPTTNGFYHLYQIGQLTPYLVGLLPDTKGWVKLSDVMVTERMMIDLYVNNGRKLPCGLAYYRWTEERNLIIAVLDLPQIANLKDDSLYIRLYSNSFLASVRSDPFDHRIECGTAIMYNSTIGENFLNTYNTKRALSPGFTWLFVNGVYVDSFIPSLTAPGSILEWVYDSTVKSVLDFPLADAPNFVSDLDAKQKYLLHHTGDQVNGPMIDYRDDIDFYLIRPYMRGPYPAFEGVYYHKNQNDATRMVTHRDYSIAVPYVLNYQSQFNGWNDVHDLTARLIIRHSGWQRPLIHEHGHIRDLYKLPAELVQDAMHGTEATVPVWQVANLENSYYPRIMGANSEDITPLMVQRAYGYNAIAKLMADTPQFVETVNGRKQIDLPPGLETNSTVFEYDANGLLIDYQYHTSGAEYTPMRPETVMIEALVGRGRPALPYTYNQMTQTVDPTLNHRCYIAQRVGETVLNDTWQDVTGDESKYSIVGNQLAWAINPLNYVTLVIDDLDFVCYSLTLSPSNGLLKFTVGAQTPLVNVPPGKIDVFLNGHALIESLDFRVVWPQIVITNKEFLNVGLTQQIVVRCTGFCQSYFTREGPAEFGFIRHGQLSRNALYNLRDDKIIRIVVKGRTYDRSQLEFVESDDGDRLPSSWNGYPYQIENVVVPLRGLVDGEDTYSYRAKSLTVDIQVADYLNLKLPEPVEPNPNMSLERYMIYSPFTSTIIHDVVNGTLDMQPFRGFYSNADVLDRLEEYRYLLDYDAAYLDDLDDRFVIIHPHNLMTEVRLDIYQHNFISRAVKLFLNDRVDLSRFLVIEP